MNPSVMESYRNILTTGPYTVGGAGNRAIRFEEIGGQLYVIIGSDTSNDSSGYAGYNLTPTGSIPVNVWTHIAVTWDSVTGSLIGYRDGAEVFNTTNTFWPSQFDNVTLGIGWGTSRPYRGQLDEVRFWNTRRSAAQIQSSMSATLQGTETGLTTYFRMDEGTGTTLTNGVSGAPNGVLGGGNASARPAWVDRTFASNVTFTIDLLRGQSATPVLNITGNAADTGQFVWTVPNTLPEASDYFIRVRRNDAATVQDTSDAPFSIRQPINIYYVNDGAFTAGDSTTAVGDNANSGLSPDQPKASISAILAAYVIKPGDTILVDAGTYTLSTALTLTAAQKGIKIQGYYNEAYPTRSTIIDRANNSFNAIELQNADDVTLDRLTFRNAYHAIYAANASDSDRLTVSNSVFISNFYSGIYVDQSNDFLTIQNNSFNLGTTYYGTLLYGSDAVVTSNSYFNNGFYGSGEVRGARSVITGNSFVNLRNGLSVNNFSASPSDRIVIRDNQYVDMREWAIATSTATTLVIDNDILRAGTVSPAVEFIEITWCAMAVEG